MNGDMNSMISNYGNEGVVEQPLSQFELDNSRHDENIARQKTENDLKEMNRNSILEAANKDSEYKKIIESQSKDIENLKNLFNSKFPELEKKVQETVQSTGNLETDKVKREIYQEEQEIMKHPILSKFYNQQELEEFMYKNATDKNNPIYLMPLQAARLLYADKLSAELSRYISEEDRKKQDYDQTISRVIPRTEQEQSLIDRVANVTDPDVKDLIAQQILRQHGLS